MKLRNGSYKDFIPDHYALGYLLVAYGREKYGDDFWKKVTHDAASFKGLFYPFQVAIKKYTGNNYVNFRKDALTYFKSRFAKTGNGTTAVTTSSKKFTDEEYPVLIEDGSILFVKSSYSKIPSFTIRNGHADRKIKVKAAALDNYFSYANGKVVYAAYTPDVRWGFRDFNDIRVLDLSTKKDRSITNHSKYFSPDISRDGRTIVAVQVMPGGQSSLHLFSAETGKIISIIPNPGKLFYTYPKFYKEDEIVSAVRDVQGKMALALINTNNGKADFLTPFSYNVIAFPAVLNDTIYYSASSGESDNLYAITLPGRKIFMLHADEHAGLGYYQPSVNNTKLVYTSFSASGYKLNETKRFQIQWIPVDSVNLESPTSSFGITALNKTNSNLLYAVPDASSTVTKYHKATGLLHFHSIEPNSNDPEYSLTLVGENILNTLQSQLAITYNRSEKWKRIGFNTVYGALFPYLSAGVDYTIDRKDFYHGNTVFSNEWEPSAGFNIPLNLSKGKTLTSLNFGSRYTYNQSDFKGVYKDTLGKISYSYLNNFLFFSNQTLSARQNIFPRFAQTVTLGYKNAITHYKGSQFVANGNVYLPGFFKNHSIILNAAYLQQDTTGQLNFSNGFPFSRGYSSVNLHQMMKWGIDYHLPLFYPDAGVGNIAYLLRIRTALFYDDTEIKDFFTRSIPFNATFRSAGTEVYFDTKWWNEALVTFGIRYSYLLDPDIFGSTGKNRWELILPVNLFKQ
ncbi:MAG: hypothetical protein H0W12_05970 [Chitinophagaceae bacterium]|nr:hypothetical protein [Chitinophagaceae bacterium]